ncbi:lipid asymmetry maintenance protein MlaB [Citrobacter sp. C348]|jgi:phospholipid transport system transporter-binding protein|uniref:Lipid asymmetry maintenance protein MlaB n=2 Tax=Citrobacter freundii complex TaxID=1344959 RepID=A0A7H9FXH6_CITFR|nr:MULTISPECIES: lipid asymmetry maintenance protein MlaB [Citrobacter]MBP8255067.1 lipid asymmetry maintenance protein MlaB [Citrobacter sp.]ATF47744.1 phospholipid ABC transporter substrate-binding protein [Citrobacter werkmanii]EJB8471975.1 lipid asymmetry maintenance protein MlaB [Citrobacter freundii]EJB8558791.1 lipid asymmetry maintenance protein MlaB [Citrobacter freundii]MBA8031057.1 lipid asymmetry maintenance protein MlaB [Citrobacter freundii]
MTQSLAWAREGDKLLLVGELDQDVLNPLWDARVEAMKGVTCIDLSQVSRVDTGGLALLVHLIDQGKRQGNRVVLSGVNDKVYTLAKLYNLPDDVLPR